MTIEAYLKELERRGRTPRYLKELRSRLEPLGDRPDEATVRAALEALSERPRTHDLLLGAVRAYVKWAGLPDVTARFGLIRKEAKHHEPFTSSELDQLLACALVPRHRRDCYLLAARTGLRKSEIRRLAPSDVDLEAAVLRLDGALTKNRKAARVPLLPDVVEALGRGIPTPPHHRTIKKDLVTAGLDPRGRGFHSLRSTFATHLAEAGVGLTTVQALMRHSDPKLTSNVYIHHRDERLREAMCRLIPSGLPSRHKSHQDAAVAQLVRAPDCGSGGRRFKSRRLYESEAPAPQGVGAFCFGAGRADRGSGDRFGDQERRLEPLITLVLFARLRTVESPA